MRTALMVLLTATALALAPSANAETRADAVAAAFADVDEALETIASGAVGADSFDDPTGADATIAALHVMLGAGEVIEGITRAIAVSPGADAEAIATAANMARGVAAVRAMPALALSPSANAIAAALAEADEALETAGALANGAFAANGPNPATFTAMEAAVHVIVRCGEILGGIFRAAIAAGADADTIDKFAKVADMTAGFRAVSVVLAEGRPPGARPPGWRAGAAPSAD